MQYEKNKTLEIVLFKPHNQKRKHILEIGRGRLACSLTMFWSKNMNGSGSGWKTK